MHHASPANHTASNHSVTCHASPGCPLQRHMSVRTGGCRRPSLTASQAQRRHPPLPSTPKSMAGGPAPSSLASSRELMRHPLLCSLRPRFHPATSRCIHSNSHYAQVPAALGSLTGFVASLGLAVPQDAPYSSTGGLLLCFNLTRQAFTLLMITCVKWH